MAIRVTRRKYLKYRAIHFFFTFQYHFYCKKSNMKYIYTFSFFFFNRQYYRYTVIRITNKLYCILDFFFSPSHYLLKRTPSQRIVPITFSNIYFSLKIEKNEAFLIKTRIYTHPFFRLQTNENILFHLFDLNRSS